MTAIEQSFLPGHGMAFAVTYKGVRYYSGRLEGAFLFVEGKWGSLPAAFEIGVKVERLLAAPSA